MRGAAATVTPPHARASCCVDASGCDAGSQWDLSAPTDYIHDFFFLSFAVYLITAVIPAFNELTEPRWTYSSVITSSIPAGWLLGSYNEASGAVTPHVATLCVTMICCQFSSCSLVSMLPFYASHSSLLAIYFKVTQAVSVVSPLCFASKKWLFYGITLRILTGP